MKKLKLTRVTAIIIGVLISVPLLIFGFLTFFGVFSRASDLAPVDLKVSNITTQSATISWTTDQESQGTIEYGTSATQLTFFSPEATRTRQHSVELTLLTPGTTHFFVIRIGDQVYDNAGTPWSFTTKPSEDTVTPTPEASPSGTITDEPEPTIKKSTTPTLTPPGAKPTLKSSTPTPTTKFACATSTDCDAILANLGPGKCSVVDYQRCRGRTITPSVTPAQSNTPSPSPTPTGITLQTPSNVTATAYSSSNVQISWWDKTNNEDGYEVQRASFAATLNWVSIKAIVGVNGNDNYMSYTDTGSDLTSGNLGSGVTYKYRVRAFGTSGGTTVYSNYGPNDAGYSVTTP